MHLWTHLQGGEAMGRCPFPATRPGGCRSGLSVKNRLDEAKFRCFPVKRTLRRQECTPRRSGGERTVYLSCSTKRFPPWCCFPSHRQRSNETDAWASSAAKASGSRSSEPHTRLT